MPLPDLPMLKPNPPSASAGGRGKALRTPVRRMEGGFNASATFFALGSTLFAWLLLRGRMIPAALGWLGLIASVLLVLCQPLQTAGLLGGPITGLMRLPMLVFEVALGFLLIIKGLPPGPFVTP